MQIGQGAGTVFSSAFGAALIVLCTCGRDAYADIATPMRSIASTRARGCDEVLRVVCL